MSRRAMVAFLLFAAAGARSATAQSDGSVPSVGGRAEIFAGGELENYLRYLQTLGEVAPYPWGLRAFSPAELDRLMPRDTLHPWAHRYDLVPSDTHGLSVEWVAPTTSARFNSTFPYGYNDGPIWAGRGVTGALQSGVALRWGPLSLTAAPLVFEAQNAAFPLMANGQSGQLAFGSSVLPTYIDLPQRFGAAPYRRFDWGQSTARLMWGPVALGVSSADQWWGPTTAFPLVLGNNAAGIPEIFVGTSHPLDLWLLRLHVRMMWGRESQSTWSPTTSAGGLRYATAVHVNISSRFVPGLEFGVTRFSHQPWPAGGLLHADLLHALRYQQAANAALALVDAQLASVYFRWVLPHTGFDVYGEYGRHDYALNVRDVIEEPDHKAGYSIGVRKVIHTDPGRLTALRLEIQNTEMSVLAQGRNSNPFYTSGSVQQGHTQLGQALGSAAGLGGGGSVVALDSYIPGGRWTWSWARILQAQRGGYALTGQPDPQGLDVQHELSVERLMFLGRYDVLAHVGGVYEFNRYFQHDAFNLNVILSVRIGLPDDLHRP